MNRNSVWICHVRPRTSTGPAASARAPTIPRTSNTSPGTKNNQLTTWTDKLDAENITPYRSGMTGCFRCPVNCRPLNDMKMPGDRYGSGDGPEYVTLGKFGPNIGVDRIESVIRLNNICNDLGFDTASTGSSIAWAMELYQRGLITKQHTQGLELTWGNADAVEQFD